MRTSKGKVKRTLLRGVYYNVPSPWGTMTANVEVWLHVQVRVGTDNQDHRDGGSGQSGDHGEDVVGGIIEERLEGIAERIAGCIEATTPTGASTERICQIELFEGMEK